MPTESTPTLLVSGLTLAQDGPGGWYILHAGDVSISAFAGPHSVRVSVSYGTSSADGDIDVVSGVSHSVDPDVAFVGALAAFIRRARPEDAETVVCAIVALQVAHLEAHDAVEVAA